MTYLRGVRAVAPADRMHSMINNISILIDGVGLAGEVVNGIPHAPPFQGDFYTIESKLFPLLVRLPANAPFYAAVRGETRPITYHITFEPLRSYPVGLSTSGLRNIYSTLLASFFVVFFERHNRWIRQTFGNQTDPWPSLFRFVWAIRNSVSHNDGTFNFNDANRPPVTWHSLQYTHADAGRTIIYNDLSPADLLILMFEFSDELDRLGCPPL